MQYGDLSLHALLLIWFIFASMHTYILFRFWFTSKALTRLTLMAFASLHHLLLAAFAFSAPFELGRVNKGPIVIALLGCVLSVSPDALSM